MTKANIFVLIKTSWRRFLKTKTKGIFIKIDVCWQQCWLILQVFPSTFKIWVCHWSSRFSMTELLLRWVSSKANSTYTVRQLNLFSWKRSGSTWWTLKTGSHQFICKIVRVLHGDSIVKKCHSFPKLLPHNLIMHMEEWMRSQIGTHKTNWLDFYFFYEKLTSQLQHIFLKKKISSTFFLKSIRRTL